MTYSPAARAFLAALAPLRGFSSPYLGIMLPSSMHTAAAFLAAHFAKKPPSWSTGPPASASSTFPWPARSRNGPHITLAQTR
jgi:hypothetical protein